MNSTKSADRLVIAAARSCFVLLIILVPWSIAPMTIAAVICSALTLISWRMRPEGPPDLTPIALPAIAWMLALLASALFALDLTASLPRLGKGLLPWLVPIVAYHARDRALGQRALALVLLSSAIAALSGTLLFWTAGASLSSRARGPTGHYMTFGGQLLLLGAVAAAVALTARSRRWRLGALAALCPSVVALAFTLTRSAWLGFIGSLAVMVGLSRPKWIPVLILGVGALVFLSPPHYRDRLLSAFQPGHRNNLERTHMWQTGWRMFRDRPLTGIGIQDLKAIYPRYRPEGATESPGHLHSVPVQIGATMGVVGLAAFAWLYFALFATAGSGLRSLLLGGTPAAGLRLGVFSGLVGFLIAGLFEWNFGDEELLYLLYVLVGLAWGARQWTRATPENAKAS